MGLFSDASYWLILDSGRRGCDSRCFSVISWSFILCWLVFQWSLGTGSVGKTTPGLLSTLQNCFFCTSWLSVMLTIPPELCISWVFNARCSVVRRLWFSFATRPAQSASLWVGSTIVSHVVGIGSGMYVSLDELAETDSPWNLAAFDTACNDGTCWVTLCGFVARKSLSRNISRGLLSQCVSRNAPKPVLPLKIELSSSSVLWRIIVGSASLLAASCCSLEPFISVEFETADGRWNEIWDWPCVPLRLRIKVVSSVIRPRSENRNRLLVASHLSFIQHAIATVLELLQSLRNSSWTLVPCYCHIYLLPAIIWQEKGMRNKWTWTKQSIWNMSRYLAKETTPIHPTYDHFNADGFCNLSLKWFLNICLIHVNFYLLTNCWLIPSINN